MNQRLLLVERFGFCNSSFDDHDFVDIQPMQYFKSILAGVIGTVVAVAILIALRSTVFKRPAPLATPVEAIRLSQTNKTSDTSVPVLEKVDVPIKSPEKIEIPVIPSAQAPLTKQVTSHPAKQPATNR